MKRVFLATFLFTFAAFAASAASDPEAASSPMQTPSTASPSEVGTAIPTATSPTDPSQNPSMTVPSAAGDTTGTMAAPTMPMPPSAPADASKQ